MCLSRTRSGFDSLTRSFIFAISGQKKGGSPAPSNFFGEIIGGKRKGAIIREQSLQFFGEKKGKKEREDKQNKFRLESKIQYINSHMKSSIAAPQSSCERSLELLGSDDVYVHGGAGA